MCGRFTLHSSPEAIQQELGIAPPPGHLPRYNIAPGQDVLTLTMEDGRLAPRLRRWGLVPGWAEDPAIGNRMINARAETVAEKPAFRGPFVRRRCLVVADGFYEWLSAGGAKRPFHIRRPSGRPFTFAALWERWGKGRHPLESCVVLTTTASDDVRAVHDRMPVILEGAARELWLSLDAPREELLSLLRPCAAGSLEAYEVSTLVNRPANDVADCLAPLAAADATDPPGAERWADPTPSERSGRHDAEDRRPGDGEDPGVVPDPGPEQLPLL